VVSAAAAADVGSSLIGAAQFMSDDERGQTPAVIARTSGHPSPQPRLTALTGRWGMAAGHQHGGRGSGLMSCVIGRTTRDSRRFDLCS
jgi:hypothetical protein